VQTSTVSVTLPAGVTPAEMATAMQVAFCEGSSSDFCAVTYRQRNASRMRRLRGRSLGSALFTVTESTTNATSNATLTAPHVDPSALASQLNISASSLGNVSSSIESIAVEISVTALGSASSATAATIVATQTSLPQTLGSALGLSASDISLVSAPLTIGPPKPPPQLPPSPEPPPPLAPPSGPPIGLAPTPASSPIAPANFAPANAELLSDGSEGMLFTLVGAGGGAVLLCMLFVLVLRKRRRGRTFCELQTEQGQGGAREHTSDGDGYASRCNRTASWILSRQAVPQKMERQLTPEGSLIRGRPNAFMDSSPSTERPPSSRRARTIPTGGSKDKLVTSHI